MSAPQMPEWALENVRKAVRRNLDWYQALSGLDLKILRSRLPQMGEDELAEIAVLTESYCSYADTFYKYATGTFDEKEMKRIANRIKKILKELFKSGKG